MNSDRKTANESVTLNATKEIAAIITERSLGLDGQHGSPVHAAYAMIAAGWKVLEVTEGDNAAPQFVDMLRDFADAIEKEYLKTTG